MTDAQKLVKKRDRIQEQLLRFSKFLDAISDETRGQLGERLSKFEELWESFNDVQIDLECLGDSEVKQAQIQFEEDYFNVVTRAKGLLGESATNKLHNSGSKIDDTDKIGGGDNSSKVKLPKIELPTFSGAYDEWVQFSEIFTSLIDANDVLPPVEKFYYLKSCLKGEAEKVIHSLELSAENYLIALGLLKSRFENKRVIIHKYIKGLFDMPSIAKESYLQLRKLVDEVQKNIRALKGFQQPVEEWDVLLLHLISNKLDSVTKRKWLSEVEAKHSSDSLPTMKEFLEFLSHRCVLLEALESNKTLEGSKVTDNSIKHKFSNKGVGSSRSFFTNNNHNQLMICSVCGDQHLIFYCKKFLDMSIEKRRNEVRRLRLCWNCLKVGHGVQQCGSGGCKKCGKKHNSLIHEDVREGQGKGQGTVGQAIRQGLNNVLSNKDKQETGSTNQGSETGESSQVVSHCSIKSNTEVLLSTARVLIKDKFGNFKEGRCLLDSGSQSNFISREFCDSLHIDKERTNIQVSGINQTGTLVQNVVHCTVKSRFNGFTIQTIFLVLDKITERLPVISVKRSALGIPENLKLADNSFDIPNKIDLLLGAAVFWELLCIGQIKLGKCQPILQKTKLGWIISGNIPCDQKQCLDQGVSCNFSSGISIQQQLEKFWTVEEAFLENRLSSEEQECERFFEKTFSRNDQGRFIIQLPFKENISDLGESRETAEKRLEMLEKRFTRNSDLKQQYSDFLTEYEKLGHMSLATDLEEQGFGYFLPHHVVTKDTSTTTKIRVVFDASAKTTSGLSLNDTLKIGPVVQDDLFSILIRFRLHSVVITGDVEKMYRQILVDESQRNFQRILWRSHSNQPIKEYTLNTITYGMSVSPYLATRCLKQIGLDCQGQYPEAGNAILKNFYVDDLLCGADSVEGAVKLRRDISSILEGYGLVLRKWASNKQEILEDIGDAQEVSHFISDDKTIKTLGLIWNSSSDELQYSVKTSDSRRVTKRIILGTISEIFDPIGLLGPIFVRAKVILQKLWQLNVEWDESLPIELHTTWVNFQGKLQDVHQIQIPRHVIFNESVDIQMHCFSDASETSYGASIYLRSTNERGDHQVNLLCAKSKVAPLRQQTLARLELLGAYLTAQLSAKVLKAIDVPVNKIYFWCDSTIVLHWLSKEPNHWKTFVANRVAEIQRLTNRDNWRHVQGKENPADIISRGSTPRELIASDLWWYGPVWLREHEDRWPKTILELTANVPEQRVGSSSVSFHTATTDQDIFSRFSSLHKLQRITAYCIRFWTNIKVKQDRLTEDLTVQELNESLQRLIKLAQSQSFSTEIQALQKSKQIPSSSSLKSLNPFLGDDGLLRVGGRISRSELRFDEKHQIILPRGHILTKLVIMNEHHKQLHMGANALLATIRLRYWPIAGRSTIRKILSKCLTCFRAKPNIGKFQMGELPRQRIVPSRPFSLCGVDFAGPFNTKASYLKNSKVVKSYFCIFVCFTTKAVHIEVVSALSTEGFLNCFKRFISRRGRPSHIFSDNGTNFVGANNYLQELSEFLKLNQNNFSEYFTREYITWHFMPPYSPHFGGLYEAAVKSAKYYLRRVVGETVLTFEELSTVLTQIEACLNSRPLHPISDDPSDLNVLTPAHFLVGAPLTALPQEDLKDENPSKLTRFKLLTQMTQHFWRRWSRDYLSQLQQRSKWQFPQPNSISVGSLVLLVEDNTPPLRWKMGRIIDTYPGSDNVIRVVSVKTSSGVFKRAITRVCVLPVETEETK